VPSVTIISLLVALLKITNYGLQLIVFNLIVSVQTSEVKVYSEREREREGGERWAVIKFSTLLQNVRDSSKLSSRVCSLVKRPTFLKYKEIKKVAKAN